MGNKIQNPAAEPDDGDEDENAEVGEVKPKHIFWKIIPGFTNPETILVCIWQYRIGRNYAANKCNIAGGNASSK